MRHTVIDHQLRRQLSLTCLQYIVIDAIMQGCDSAYDISRQTGIAETTIKQTVESLWQFVTEDYTLTQDFMKAYQGDVIPERKKKDIQRSDFPTKVIELFNEVNGTKYKPDTYYNQIVKIQKKIGEDIDRYHSVILHKKLSWGQDQNMSDYNRPSTIFRSPERFVQYLDEATIFWNKKVRDDSYVNLGA